MMIIPIMTPSTGGPGISDEEYKKILGVISSILLIGFIGGCVYAAYYPDYIFKGLDNYVYRGIMGMMAAMFAAMLAGMTYLAVRLAYNTVRDLLSGVREKE